MLVYLYYLVTKMSKNIVVLVNAAGTGALFAISWQNVPSTYNMILLLYFDETRNVM